MIWEYEKLEGKLDYYYIILCYSYFELISCKSYAHKSKEKESWTQITFRSYENQVFTKYVCQEETSARLCSSTSRLLSNHLHHFYYFSIASKQPVNLSRSRKNINSLLNTSQNEWEVLTSSDHYGKPILPKLAFFFHIPDHFLFLTQLIFLTQRLPLFISRMSSYILVGSCFSFATRSS